MNPLDRGNQRARPAPLRIMNQAHATAHPLGMSVQFHPALRMEEELYGDAILTALPMRLVKAGPLPGSVGFEPRGALWAAVEANGTEIQIINTHLGLPVYERMAQAKTLLGQNWLGHPDCRDPVILLGDFNTRRRSVVYRMFTARSRDAQLVAVATFLFGVLPDDLQVSALRELGRVVKAGGIIRLLEYVRPRGAVRRAITRLWEPWVAWAYGAGFNRRTEERVPDAGLELTASRFVAEDLIKLLSIRVLNSP